ncbi:Ig-like domain-containing protein [Sporolactobacillus sp. KGMB 08714]|uniref:Ig-like domain-containing protein n=1 Tax=Sporolactobacillus sp. KGMB 08714 TaxID=3064704 RepID=UPI002FBE3AB6
MEKILKIAKFIGLLFFASCFVLVLNPHASAASTVSGPRGMIDDPVQGKTLEGTVLVRGWFLDMSGVSKIEVLIDGKVVGNATYGQSRPDVYKAYPQYQNSNSGYQYSLNTAQFTNGTHQLSVRETGKNGVQATINRTVNVQNLAVQERIDGPAAGSTLQGTATVRGWFLDTSGVSKVEVLVDGKVIGNATYGISRPDVYKAYPQYQNSNSGYQYNLNTSQFTDGTHQLSVRETGKNGVQTTISRSVTVKKIAVQGRIDGPAAGSTLQGTATVRGWFLDTSGVSKVEVLIDGKVTGNATYGISRPDVYKAYPQYQNSNSGYQYSLNTAQLTNGTHQLSVRETGKNGAQTTISRTVNVQNLPVQGRIDSPAAGSTLQGTTTVRGWFLDVNGVSKIEVLVDGKVIGSAAYGQSRPDVNKAYPQYQNSNSGYQYSLNTSQFTDGTHQLSVRETGKNGAQTTISCTVTVKNLPVQGRIDNPGAGSTIQGIALVRGWFLDVSGVSKVDVYVDNQYQGTATYGLSRPDVGSAYPAYGNSNAGYQFYLKSYLLSAGSHTLTIKETGKDGGQSTISRSVNVVLPPGGAIQEGIDISNNNGGSIDFQAVRNSGISFVIAKASEGTTFVDPTFKTNIVNAMAAGLNTSAYHFFQSTNDPANARVEANQFAAILKSIGFNGYAFVDVEVTNSGDTKASVTNSVNAFLDQLKQDGISKIGIYSYLSYYDTYLDLSTLQSHFPDLLVWTAAWHSASLGPQTTTDLWQFTDNGSVNGITGSVDMDLSYNSIF